MFLPDSLLCYSLSKANTTQIIVEDEDGEVVKKYDLPGQKPQGDLMSQSLKYMGMGVFAKAMDKSTATAETPAEAEDGESSAQKARKKSVVEEQQDEDDRHIRFTIGGVGRRMTKEDFIKEMKKHDKTTRHEVVERSTASHGVKVLAKQDPQPQMGESSIPAPATVTSPRSRYAASQEDEAVSPHQRSRSSSPGKPTAVETPSGEAPETEVERGRRLAVLQGVSDDGEVGETAAERRRREAALGMGAEDDSDDDDTPRVPPFRKSIRFADVPKNKGGPA